VPLVAAVAFVQGVSFTAYGLAERASLPRLVHTDLLPAALAQNEAKTRGAALAGPPLGGALFGVAAALPFLANAVGYVAATVAATAVRTDLRSTAGRRTESLWAEATSGLRWTWRSPLVRATSLLVAGSNFLFQAMVLTIVVRATETGASAGRVGVMLGIFGAGGLLGALVAAGSYRVFSPKTVVIGVNWVWALLFPLLATTHNPVLLGLICAGSAFMGPMWNVVIGAYQLMLVPDELRGRVGSASTMMAWGVIPLGSLAAGYLLELRGSTFTIVAMAVAMVAIALAATFSPAVRSAPASTMDLGHFATAGGSKVSKVQTRGSV
jgi:predicted MFS family arabinose efflux permease